MAKRFIQVYNDKGTGPTGLQHMVASLQAVAPGYKIIHTNGNLVRQKHLLSETALVCFGGGYDMGYLSSLREAGCKIIREYIERGGRYLGVCAGAYFGSNRCVFDEGGHMEVIGRRPIRMFEGDAVGPYYPGFVYDSEEGSYAAKVTSASGEIVPKTATAYFNGGCTFRSDTWTRTKVLYNYESTKDPAIIACRLGQGVGLLSGVHFEYDPARMHTPEMSEREKQVLAELEADSLNRSQLWTGLIERLLQPDCNFDGTKGSYLPGCIST